MRGPVRCICNSDAQEGEAGVWVTQWDCLKWHWHIPTAPGTVPPLPSWLLFSQLSTLMSFRWEQLSSPLAEFFLTTCSAENPWLAVRKPGFELALVAHTYNSGPWEVEAGVFGGHGQPWLSSKFKANLEPREPVWKSVLLFSNMKTISTFKREVFGFPLLQSISAQCQHC